MYPYIVYTPLLLDKFVGCIERSHSDAMGWGTALQAGRSRVRFPIVSFEYFIDLHLPGCTMAMGSIQALTDMSTRNISWG